jgi:hypothetical protein
LPQVASNRCQRHVCHFILMRPSIALKSRTCPLSSPFMGEARRGWRGSCA